MRMSVYCIAIDLFSFDETYSHHWDSETTVVFQLSGLQETYLDKMRRSFFDISGDFRIITATLQTEKANHQ